MTFLNYLNKEYDEMILLKVSLGYNKNTYKYYIPDFINFCGKNYSKAKYVTKDMVVDWLSITNFKSSNTKTRALINLRTFTKFLFSKDNQTYVIDDEFSLHIIPYVPVIMKNEELAQFFVGVDSTIKSNTMLNKCYILPVLFRLIFCCGLRPAEPLSLLSEDVDLINGDIYIRQSKRRTDRHIIMSNDMLNLCKCYDSIMGKRKWFFQDCNGKQLTTKWLGHQFELCYKNSKLNLPKIPNTYSLRHCFASYVIIDWIDTGKDVLSLLPFLSAYMGHTDIKHTLYYVHLLPQRLKSSSGIDWSKLDSIYGEV